MRILYYTSGVSGSGRVVQGISIFNALLRRRMPADYILLSSSPACSLAERLGVPHAEIPLEDEHQLCRRVLEHFEVVPLSGILPTGRPACGPALVPPAPLPPRAVLPEGFPLPPGRRALLFPGYTARPDFHPARRLRSVAVHRAVGSAVSHASDQPHCRAQQGGNLGPRGSAPAPGAASGRNLLPVFLHRRSAGCRRGEEDVRLPSTEGYQTVYAADHPAGLSPVVDYFHAFDYLISGAGYNSFWEAVYFQKEAYFLPRPRHFEDQRWRVAECQDRLLRGERGRPVGGTAAPIIISCVHRPISLASTSSREAIPIQSMPRSTRGSSCLAPGVPGSGFLLFSIEQLSASRIMSRRRTLSWM